MNKQDFIKQKRAEGWKVERPEKWLYKEDRDISGVTHKIYDVSVKDDKNCVGIVEVAIADEGRQNNEGTVVEDVKPIDWELNVVPFDVDLRDYLDDEEAADKKIFTISVDSINIEDETAEIVVYNKKNGGVEAELNVVRRRAGTFQREKIINQTNV